MSYRFSPTTGAFYPDDIAYALMPADCIPATDSEFSAAMAAGPSDTLAVVDGAVVVVPYAGPTLAQAKAGVIAMLHTAYAAALNAPVAYTTAAGATAHFAQGPQAEQDIASVLAQGVDAWMADIWLDAAGNPVAPFSFADVAGLNAAIGAADTPAHVDLLMKIAAVHGADSVAAVQAITF